MLKKRWRPMVEDEVIASQLEALAREGLLWCNPTQISQQAVSNRFLTFPHELFERVFKDLLPSLKLSWSKRKRRPLPESVQYTLDYSSEKRCIN